MHVSEICVKQICVNQGLGVVWFGIEGQIKHDSDFQSTPSPWLTRIRLTRISLTRIFKKFPFLT